jgi:hypothetical protein
MDGRTDGQEAKSLAPNGGMNECKHGKRNSEKTWCKGRARIQLVSAPGVRKIRPAKKLIPTRGIVYRRYCNLNPMFTIQSFQLEIGIH